MELFQGARNKQEMTDIRRFLADSMFYRFLKASVTVRHFIWNNMP